MGVGAADDFESYEWARARCGFDDLCVGCFCLLLFVLFAAPLWRGGSLGEWVVACGGDERKSLAIQNACGW